MVDITERLRLNATDWIFGDTAITALKEINTLRQRVIELEAVLWECRANLSTIADLRNLGRIQPEVIAFEVITKIDGVLNAKS